MTLVQWRHFVSIADSGSFSRSAQELFITQPALSRSIRALEVELGESLFDRLGRQIQLTYFGTGLLQRARQLVLDAELLTMAGQHAGRKPLLRLGLGSGPATLLTDSLLMQLAGNDAPARIEILRGDTDGFLQALRTRALDAVVTETRSFPPGPDLRVERLIELRGALMCRRGHPLARRRGALTFEAVRAYPLASTRVGPHVVRALVDAYGPQAHPELGVDIYGNDLSSLITLARGSNVVLHAIRAAAPDLVELILDPPVPGSAIFGLVTLAGRKESPALPLLRTLIQAGLRDVESG